MLEPFRTLYLTASLIALPWIIFIFRFTFIYINDYYHKHYDVYLLVLRWLPTLLVTALVVFQKPLELDPEFGMALALFYLFVISPMLVIGEAVVAARAKKRERERG